METMKLKNERKKKEISEKKEVGEVITIARRNLVGEKLKLDISLKRNPTISCNGNCIRGKNDIIKVWKEK